MATPIIDKTATDKTIIVWQEVDDGIPEPALMVTPYSDTINITQGANSINLNYDTVNEFCKLLRKLRP